MNGFSLCLTVLYTASAVLGQGLLPQALTQSLMPQGAMPAGALPAGALPAGALPPGALPPTRTRKGTRPAGRPFAMPSPVAPAPAPAAPVVYNPLPAPSPAPVAAPYIPPAQTYLPPQQQFLPPQQPMVNPFMPPAQPQMPIQLPPQMPAPAPTPAASLLNFFNLFAPTPPPTPASCASQCTTVPFNQVCSMFGTTFTNDCYLQCSGEPFACMGPCPCPAPPQPIYHQMSECGYCRNPFAFGEDYNPVCVEDDKTLYNECEARCKGKTIKCSSNCPC